MLEERRVGTPYGSCESLNRRKRAEQRVGTGELGNDARVAGVTEREIVEEIEFGCLYAARGTCHGREVFWL